MLSTIIYLALLLGLLAAVLGLLALLLRLGLRWARVSNVTMGRVALATLLVFVLQGASTIPSYLLSPGTRVQAMLLDVVSVVAGGLVPCLVIKWVFHARFLRFLQAWLPTLLTPVVPILFLFFVSRPFLFEAFTCPTNSMAPTLLGNHWQGTCSECGQPAFCTPVPRDWASQGPPWMICRDNFHMTQSSEYDDHTLGADRFLAAKFLRPRRWDLVVFRYPEDPSQRHVKRLVGLPGETIEIKDGHVWADGRQLTPPDSIRGLRYLSEIPDLPRWPIWGTPARPAKLGPDEYFVLGDFSAQSKDSRLLERGAPGHNPFAVPESYLIGVVTHIFWPPHRCRVLR